MELGRARQGGQKRIPTATGKPGWGVFRKPHTIMRLALVTGCLLSPQRGQGTNSAAGSMRCVCPSRLSSFETLGVESGENVPKARFLWENGWLCLFILLHFIIPPERKRVVI